MVLDPARVNFCVENEARLGLAQQEALDAPSDQLVAYVLLDGEAIPGGDHALIEAELLVGAVVAAKEREHSVDHGPCRTCPWPRPSDRPSAGIPRRR